MAPSNTRNPNPISRSTASQLKEHNPLITTYEHLSLLPRAPHALKLLRQIASVVKPLMRKRSWRVTTLSEFLPPERNLLGLNINQGWKICIRLRFHDSPELFLPVQQVVDTLLHELAHVVWGEHDGRFYALWEELRSEHEVLVRKGFSGEGFLGEGRRLGGGGGGGGGGLRGLVGVAAGKRGERSLVGLGGEGRKLGGRGLTAGGRDVREVIAGQALARSTVDKGCGSGRADAGRMAEMAGKGAVRTREEEDEADQRAIAQAVIELEDEEEGDGVLRKPPRDGGLAWSREQGLYDPKTEKPRAREGEGRMQGLTEEEQLRWAMEESRRLHLHQPSSSSSSSSTTSSSNPKPQLHRPRPSADPNPTPPHSSPKPPQPAPQTIDLTSSPSPPSIPAPPNLWTCEICTCTNPTTYLLCSACEIERPSPTPPSSPSRRRRRHHQPPSTAKPPALQTDSHRLSRAAEIVHQAREKEARERAKQEAGRRALGWNCAQCGSWMEHRWWTCSACGVMKGSSS